VIVEDADVRGFRSKYKELYSYIASRYREAAVLGFGDTRRPFRVLVDQQRSPVSTDPRWSLPCFRTQ